MEAELHRSDAPEIADALVNFCGVSFGGKRGGRFRISRKFLRQIAGRRKLPGEFIRELADELFERGFVLVDLETHFAVLSQNVFNSYRRVTDKVFATLEPSGASAHKESLPPSPKKDGQSNASA